MDQAPGPIIANVPPNAASMSDVQMSPPPAIIQSSTTATSAPTMGVHNPARMNSPRTAPVISGIVRPAFGVSGSAMPL
jgi:hypothetical protein